MTKILIDEALRLADEFRPTMPREVMRLWGKDAAAELSRLHHNNEVLMNALMKACGDDEQVVKDYIESQGELK